MQGNPPLIETMNALRLRISHAVTGTHYHANGRNTLPSNRLFFITDAPDGGYIRRWRDGVEQENMPLLAGGIYFIPKDVQLEYNFVDGLGIAAFHFNLEYIAGWDVFNGQENFHEWRDAPELAGAIHRLIAAAPSLDRVLRAQSAVLELSSRLLEGKGVEIVKLQDVRAKYAALLGHLEARADAQATVEELADLMGMSRDALSKAFKKDFGVPLKSFLTRLLVQKAAERLIYTDMKARDVAAELRFNNEYYFSKFFKKHKGLSPAQFRAEMR